MRVSFSGVIGRIALEPSIIVDRVSSARRDAISTKPDPVRARAPHRHPDRIFAVHIRARTIISYFTLEECYTIIMDCFAPC